MKLNIYDLTGDGYETLLPFELKMHQRGRVSLTLVDSEKSCSVKSASTSALLGVMVSFCC